MVCFACLFPFAFYFGVSFCISLLFSFSLVSIICSLYYLRFWSPCLYLLPYLLLFWSLLSSLFILFISSLFVLICLVTWCSFGIHYLLYLLPLFLVSLLSLLLLFWYLLSAPFIFFISGLFVLICFLFCSSFVHRLSLRFYFLSGLLVFICLLLALNLVMLSYFLPYLRQWYFFLKRYIYFTFYLSTVHLSFFIKHLLLLLCLTVH